MAKPITVEEKRRFRRLFSRMQAELLAVFEGFGWSQAKARGWRRMFAKMVVAIHALPSDQRYPLLYSIIRHHELCKGCRFGKACELDDEHPIPTVQS